MAKPRKSGRNTNVTEDPKPGPAKSHAVRETIESVAVAFVLAFLFRTFVAEAFIIPTGSMSPSLMGAHKDVECSQCNTRFKVNSSNDDVRGPDRKLLEAGVGVCPECRHVEAFREAIGNGWGDPTVTSVDAPNYSGDRIVVSKYQYALNEPERWDVVVFKYPGDAVQNYIKRLVGLPNETLRVWQGDIFVGPPDASSEINSDDFAIERRTPAKVMAMRQFVHDTDHDAAALYRHGFPLRWRGDNAESAWERGVTVDDKNAQQTYTTAPADADAIDWLRYRHILADPVVWNQVNKADIDPAMAKVIEQGDLFADAPPQLIADFNSYNTREFAGIYTNPMRISQIINRPVRAPAKRPEGEGSVLQVSPQLLGTHWTGDLMLEAELQAESASGTLWLQLVEAGHQFRCAIDLATGKATLSIIPWESDAPVDSFAPTASTAIKGKGAHKIQFANVDDQLLLWIDGELVEFEMPTTYDWQQLFGPRDEIRPRLGDDNTGDMAPAAIGTEGAALAVNRLALFRDIYYISTDNDSDVSDGIGADVLREPTRWAEYTRRSPVQFALGPDQFFVMGDNSPQSKDARIWNQAKHRGDRPPNGWPLSNRGQVINEPGGAFLSRKLLIGRAVFVAWPHPWYKVVPNFGDMRLIR